jgi:hypothetical protein
MEEFGLGLPAALTSKECLGERDAIEEFVNKRGT